MGKSILNLQVSSLQELDKNITELKNRNIQNGHLPVLNLYGSQILVRQFALPLRSSSEIRNALKLEAAEVFSLLPEEIEIDYQIMDSLNGKTKEGVFVCVPKRLFKEYVTRLKKARLLPERVTANIFSRINYFLLKNKIKSKNLYIIDFFKEGMVNLAMFEKGVCQLLRETQYENFSDAEREIVYSLKYAFSKSAHKGFDAIYALGNLSDKEELISNLEKHLNTDIKKSNTDGRIDTIDSTAGFFSVDLIRKYIFPSQMRKKISFMTNAILLVSLVLFLLLSLKVFGQYIRIRNLSAASGASVTPGGSQESLLKNAK